MRVSELCYGCSTCEKVCPVKAIHMERQDDGSYVATYEVDTCKNCSLCKKVCPALSPKEKQNVKSTGAYCAWSQQNAHVKSSSSGGVFYELALLWLAHGGYVCGAVYSDKHSVQHVVTNDYLMVEKMRGSKYSDSDLSHALLQVRSLLNEGKDVLFSGTPCQCKAVRNIAMNHDRLICVEVICNGVMYPIVLEKEIQRLEREVNADLVSYTMRHKVDSYFPLYMQAVFANGQEITEPFYQTVLGQIYGSRIALKEACYKCRFKGFPRVGDITLGDYHNFSLIDDEITPSEYGASTVLVNSKKGMQIIQEAAREGKIIAIQAASIQTVIRTNSRLVINGYFPSKKKRKRFKQGIVSMNIEDMAPMVKRYYLRDKVILRKITELIDIKKAIYVLKSNIE